MLLHLRPSSMLDPNVSPSPPPTSSVVPRVALMLRPSYCYGHIVQTIGAANAQDCTAPNYGRLVFQEGGNFYITVSSGACDT